MKKLRNFLIAGLLMIAVVGLFWGLWEITTPDIAASPSNPVKSLGASNQVEPLPSVAEAVPALSESLNSAPALDTTESTISDGSLALDTAENPAETTDVAVEPSAVTSPPTPDAVLTTPLADAEHHVFKLRVATVEVTITRFHRVLDDFGNRTIEYVDMVVWQSSTIPMNGLNLPLNQFSLEDQQYIRNWAQQQAASAASAAPVPEQ